MTEKELEHHIKKFASHGQYMLEVESSTTYASINLSDRNLAFMLCDTAKKSGVAKSIRLFRHHSPDTEEVLYDSDLPC